MIYDPHSSKFVAKNLREEEWREYQRDQTSLDLANQIKEILSNGLVAVISDLTLSEIGFDVAAKAAIPAVLLQMAWNPHWSALAICMLCHGMMENFPDEGVTRFYLSPELNEPMYGDNVRYMPDPIRGWSIPVLRTGKVDEAENTGTTRDRQDESTHAVSRKRTGAGDSAQQNLFSDLY